ncbi:MAG: hypothetical protein AUJ55_05140 [Proteobacteria bacterium CG1_02_64_396]|nr:MAG: hypothetical protein AUJ55_05140 [Proteobacteria bacterium CG1_02_64_396]
MATTLHATQAMLDAHHRDGAKFAQMMIESFHHRFGDAFWSDWDRLIGPVLPEQPTLIDLGSGPGMLVQALGKRYQGGKVYGVECAPYMLEAQVDMPVGCEILVADLHDPKLPLPDNSVDAAMASVVLHEMTQPIRALQEVFRCLKPGGRMFVLDWVRAPLARYVEAQTTEEAVFGPEATTESLDDLFTHFIEHNRFTWEDLVYICQKVGFTVREATVMRMGRYARLIIEKPQPEEAP